MLKIKIIFLQIQFFNKITEQSFWKGFLLVEPLMFNKRRKHEVINFKINILNIKCFVY